ncbi:MAG: GNAT family N-acetyltransferase [Acidimicrobiales bacterium]
MIELHIDPTVDPRWADLSRRRGTLFDSPPWLAAIRDGFGIEPHAHISKDASSGFVVGFVDDEIGPRTVSYPFSDYCGPLGVATGDAWQALAGTNLDGALPFRIRSRSHPIVDADSRLSPVGRYAWHGIDLESDEHARWKKLSGPARQNVRRAERENVIVTVDSSRQALAGFETLHRRLRRDKYRMLSQPPEYFDALERHFGDDLVVLHARVDEELVAAVVLLRWAEAAYYKFNASVAAASSVRGNDVLMWEAMQHAADVWGCSSLDLGLSDLDQTGLLRYKAKFATRTDEIIAHSISVSEPDEAVVARARVNATVDQVIASGSSEAELIEVSRDLYRFFC